MHDAATLRTAPKQQAFAVCARGALRRLPRVASNAGCDQFTDVAEMSKSRHRECYDLWRYTWIRRLADTLTKRRLLLAWA